LHKEQHAPPEFSAPAITGQQIFPIFWAGNWGNSLDYDENPVIVPPAMLLGFLGS
jgi:hypothetical protein